MDIQDMKVFQAVAKAGSFSGAAQALNYAQSNISTKMQHLEAELQTTLFYRYNRGITLTAQGELLLEYAAHILQLLDETETVLRDDGVARGPLAIGSMETTASVYLPQMLAGYHALYPEVHLSLTTGHTSQNIEKILEHTVDGAFIAGPIHHPALTGQPFSKETLYLVTAAAEPQAASWKELKNRTLLVFPQGCSYRAALEGLLRSEHIPSDKIITMNSLSAVIASICAGLGISLLPDSVISRYVQQGLMKKYQVTEEYAYIQTFFAFRRDHPMNTAFKKFLETAQGDGSSVRC